MEFSSLMEVLLCFKSIKEINHWKRYNMSDMMKKATNINPNIYEMGNKRYKCAVMNKNASCGYRPDEVFFINCFLDDCEDKDFLSDLEHWEDSGTVVHYW